MHHCFCWFFIPIGLPYSYQINYKISFDVDRHLNYLHNEWPKITYPICIWDVTWPGKNFAKWDRSDRKLYTRNSLEKTNTIRAVKDLSIRDFVRCVCATALVLMRTQTYTHTRTYYVIQIILYKFKWIQNITLYSKQFT